VSDSARETVLLLQSQQSLGQEALAAFHSAVDAAEMDLRVLRTGLSPLLREHRDIPPAIVETVLSEDQWPTLMVGASNVGAIVTNDEYLQGTARSLCLTRGIRSRIPASYLRYRDKGLMRQALAAAGIPVPVSLLIRDQQVTPFGNDPELAIGETIVVKPTDEANLRGIKVKVFDSACTNSSGGDYLIERFLEGPQYHSEVFVENGIVSHLYSGRYVRPLLDLTRGRVAGSVRTDPLTESRLGRLAERACGILGTDGTFTAHVEFLSADDGPDSLRVGEVCARAPGGEIPFQATAIGGYDLEEVNLAAQAGLTGPRPNFQNAASAGWLWQVGRPLRQVTLQAPPDELEVRYSDIVLGGRVRVSGGDVTEVDDAVEQIIRANTEQ